ncbi:unnamed protein product, partial [Cyprideis torosa]
MGMAHALGYRFLDDEGCVLPPIGQSLERICVIEKRQVDSRLADLEVDAVCDVENPLTGRDGASYVYSPQKGGSPSQVALLDRGLGNLADLVYKEMGLAIQSVRGAGAAGADLVITGEGRLDRQTACYDKAPAVVAHLARQCGIPCVAICGMHPMSLEEAMQRGPELLANTAEQGRRKEAAEKNIDFPFDPAGITNVLLSHAHIDHSGRLPLLQKGGFPGRILATRATRDACRYLLTDSAKIQESDAQYLNYKT